MEKTMTVKDLVQKYDAAVEKAKPIILKEIKSEKYIPYEAKIMNMGVIVNATHRKKDGSIYMNTPMQFVLFTLHIIDNYTNIKIDSTHLMDEFNMLHKSGLIDIIVHPHEWMTEIIPVSEINECAEILSMMSSDFMQNNFNLHALLREVLSVFKNFDTQQLLQFITEYHMQPEE